ncbi:nucleotidyltransferase domain-containing protein [Alteromonas facilis]|uniref:nucleotidyltransferase domain-containing protein n=1 Tax=Alteromonas facilis TaxID=2048004 RepID=UPI000C28B353|nr:nucleotidyltransferase domain-containing protein [Alteromonas facilis]
MKFPKSLPAAHKRLLLRIVESFSMDHRILGIGAGGSFASDAMDQYSDLDLVIAIDPEHYDTVMSMRFELVETINGLVAAVTGEHVGEPRLVIALYEPDLIHVDFKFVALPDAGKRVDDTKVVWEREQVLSELLTHSDYAYPCPTPQWVEDRFWIWVHYAATKIARGEYYEAMEFLSFLRTTVLSPVALALNGHTPSGVRTIEQRLPQFAEALTATIAKPEKASLISAFQHIISLYKNMRSQCDVELNSRAERLCVEYFDRIVGADN